MKPLLPLLAVTALTAMLSASILSVTPAQAHDDVTLDKTTAPNGGQLRMAGAYHLELVLAQNGKETDDKPVVVYVTDHADAKLPSAGLKASVTLLGAGRKTTVSLTPDGDNRLTGRASYAATPDLKAVVALTLADGKREQARFTPFAKAAAAKSPPSHQH